MKLQTNSRHFLFVLFVAGVASACSEGNSAGDKADAAPPSTADASGTGGATTSGTGGTTTGGTDAGRGGAPGTDGSVADGGVADAGNAGLPLDDLGSRLIAGLCQKVFACCPAELRAKSLIFSSSVAQCRFLLDSEGAGLAAEIAAHVGTGKLVYDPIKAAECLADSARLTCTEARTPGGGMDVLPSCIAAVYGTVANGGDCDSDLVCRDGWCDFNSGGKCVPPLANGQPCDNPGQCLSEACDVDKGQCVPNTVDPLCTF